MYVLPLCMYVMFKKIFLKQRVHHLLPKVIGICLRPRH